MSELKASELMLNNCILVETAQSKSYYAKITEINSKGYKYNIDRLKWGVPVRVKPIPLTPEILLKAGFENRYGNEYFFMKLKFSYEINELSQFVRFHYSGKVTYLQYLHELQNLVKCLTSHELTINL